MKFATHDLRTNEGVVTAKETTTRLVNWLNTLPDCSNATPVIVSIGLTTYVGARYTKTHSIGKTRKSIRYYLLGKLPRSYVRNHQIVYRCESVHTDYDLFVAGYATEETVNNPQFASFHPFGEWFVLHVWDHEALDSRIDTYDEYRPYPRPRMNIKIHNLV
jgi:hypothetical protein